MPSTLKTSLKLPLLRHRSADFYRSKTEYQQHGRFSALVDPKYDPKEAQPIEAPQDSREIPLFAKLRMPPQTNAALFILFARYRSIKISEAGVRRILKRNGVARLPRPEHRSTKCIQYVAATNRSQVITSRSMCYDCSPFRG